MSKRSGGDDAVTEGRKARYEWNDPSAKGELEWIDKSKLEIDYSYQREVVSTKVERLAERFSWPAFGVLVVARRGGKLYVAEGQHRLMAARKRSDISLVPCVIFDSKGKPYEARVFLDANAERKPVTAIAKFKAMIVERDATALAVNKMVVDAGRTVAQNSAANTVACVSLLCRLHTTVPDYLARIWPLVVELCENSNIPERVVDSLVYIEKRLPDGVSLTDRKWKSRLLSIGPEQLMRAIAGSIGHYQAGGAKVWSRGILRALNHGMRDRLRIVGDDEEGEI
jgi:hypothetical protein